MNEAVLEGCRVKMACGDLEIDFKTYIRWGRDVTDKRSGPISAPANKLSEEIRTEVLSISTSLVLMRKKIILY